MYNVFKKFTRSSASNPLKKTVLPPGYHFPLSAATLLTSPEYERSLQMLWDNTVLPREHYQRYYLQPLEHCVELMQRFPYAPTGPYAGPGGMVDATLEILARAVRLSKRHMLPSGSSPEQQAAQNAAWNGVVFYSALFSSLTPLCHIAVEMQNGQIWSPIDGPLNEPYRFRFKSELSPEREQALTAVLASRMLPQEGIAWLTSCPDAIETLAFYLMGFKDRSCVITSIVEEAMTGVITFNKPSATSEIIDETQQTQNKSRLNELPRPQERGDSTGGASDVEVTQPSLKKNNLGNDFWQWLKLGCCSRRLAVNHPQGNIHLVAGFVFIRVPGIFHQFLAEQALPAELKPQLQKAFEKLGKHRNERGGMYSCHLYENANLAGGYKKLNGYFIVIKMIYGDLPAGKDNATIMVK